MWSIDHRTQVLANCKCLYGPDIEILTFSYNNGLYQAVAMKFDPGAGSWTRFLHSTDRVITSSQAISSLLYETEKKIAELFSTNGWNLPLSGDPVQSMTPRRVQTPPTTNGCGHSGNSSSVLINTPDLKSQNDAVLEGEDLHVESTTVQTKIDVEPAVREFPQEDIATVKETPDHLCAVANIGPPMEDDELASFNPKKKTKKKKGKGFAIEEIPEPDPKPMFEPEPVPVNDSGWGSFGTTKKDKKKKGKGFAVADIPKPEPVPEPVLEPAPEPVFEPEPVPVDDSGWGSFGTTKKDKKKKGKGFAVADIPEPEPVPEPVPEPAPEPVLVQDDGWGAYVPKAKDKKKKKKGVPIDEVAEPQIEPEPEPAPVEDDDTLRTARKDESQKGQPIAEDVLTADVPTNGLPTEASKSSPAAAAVKSSAWTTLPPEIGLADPTSQTRTVKTVVLKIIHTSRAGTQTIQTMVNISDNTEEAIVDAVNHYLNHSCYVRDYSISRSVDIKSGSGKSGDIDLSNLERGRWPECLEYLSQYTRFPELTVHASDGQV
ncbi:hypothetical protein PVAG01_08475 [Phlyctema vagabunda]|uniref:Uncharacterized protein n=1 Tax=Phlyctema vagabunda TaxID=108571 RepID=A0ABR4PA66_9HELO